MARIRTIKPEFFKHEDLYDAEIESGLPLRIAFAGLWTQCDREGRFRWRCRQLKTDILPYDDIEFSRVLDTLATRGFIVKYASNGEDFGFIPSWHKHQVINNREKESEFPDPNEVVEIINEPDACSTREPRVVHASPTRDQSRKAEGKGREGKGIPPSEDAESAVIDFGTVIFGQCLSYLTNNGVLEKNARSLLGKWRKGVGDGDVIKLITEAEKQSVSEPIAWIEAAINRGAGDGGYAAWEDDYYKGVQ